MTASFEVPVGGGKLAVHELAGGPGDQRTVIALHGITANALSFVALARALPAGTRLLAPDLRGRAESAAIAGPWGIAEHVTDLLALIDHQRLGRVTVLGHSMGAFVAAYAAAKHPDRVDRVVLVDGGVGFPPPADADIDTMLTAVIGPAMTRLSQSFDSAQDYYDYLTANPAIAEVLDAGGEPARALLAYLDHDLIERGDGKLVSSCVVEAIRADGGQLLVDEEILSAVRTLEVPTAMLWAPRGLLNQTPGLYTAELLAAAGLSPSVTTEPVPDCNHYSIVLAPHALTAIVAALG